MKIISHILLLLLSITTLLSCTNEKVFDKKQLLRYEIRAFWKNNDIDTLRVYDKSEKYYTKLDSVHFINDFSFGKINHTLKKISNLNHPPIDGELNALVLDDLGVIYAYNIYTNAYTRTYFNNDSLNTLIQYSIERAFVLSEKQSVEKILKDNPQTIIIK